MSLPRLFLLVAIGGLLGAVLVWGALALVYGPEVALVLRVVFSAAVAAVVCSRGRTPPVGASAVERPPVYRSAPMAPEAAAEIVAANRVTAPDVDHWIEPGGVVGVDPAIGSDGTVVVIDGKPVAGFYVTGFSDPDSEAAERRAADALGLRWEDIKAGLVEAFECLGEDVGSDVDEVGGMLAGDPFAGAVYPSGGHGKRGKRRPGQWGWRARMLRARRLDRAEQRRERVEVRPMNRADLRRARRLILEAQARANYGIEPLPGEFTTALRDRVLRACIIATAPRGLGRADLETLSGGVVEVDHETATARITMPAGTSAERCEAVRADIEGRVPAFVAVEVVCATS